MSTFNEYGLEKTDLRIYRVLDTDQNIHDESLIEKSFTKEPVKYVKGKTPYMEFTHEGDLVFTKHFIEERDKNGKITRLLIKHEYYNEKGEVSKEHTNQKVAKKFSEPEAETYDQKIRDKQRNFLIGEAIRKGAFSYIEIMLGFWRNEIIDYITSGSRKWEIAVKSHKPKYIKDDPKNGPDKTAIETKIYEMLSAKIDGVTTIRELILNQISKEI